MEAATTFPADSRAGRAREDLVSQLRGAYRAGRRCEQREFQGESYGARRGMLSRINAVPASQRQVLHGC
jgi:hypothetical protein